MADRSPILRSRATLRRRLEELDAKARVYNKDHQKYLNYDTMCDVLVALLNFTIVSSIFIGGPVDNERAYLISSATLSTLAGLIFVFQRSFNFRSKYQSFQISSKQYKDLVRDISLLLARQNLTLEDCSRCLTDITQRLSVIEDSTIPIDFHDSDIDAVEEEIVKIHEIKNMTESRG